MRFPLHLLNIDQYINWYHNLSYSLQSLSTANRSQDKWLSERYLVASFGLYIRYEINNRNAKSLALSDEFKIKGEQLAKKVDDLIEKKVDDDLGIYTHERLKDIYFLPDLAEWETINYLRETGLQMSIDDYTKDKSKSFLSEMEFARFRLEQIETNLYPAWIEQAANCKPLLKTETIDSEFASGLSVIDFTKYLNSIISGNQHADPVTPIAIKWSATKNDLIELIKALIAANAVGGQPEKEIFKAFQNFTGIEIMNSYSQRLTDITTRNSDSETKFLSKLMAALKQWVNNRVQNRKDK